MSVRTGKKKKAAGGARRKDGKRSGEADIAALIATLESAAGPGKRRTAAAALGRAKAVEAVPALQRAAMAEEAPLLKRSVLAALRRIGEPAARTTFVAHLTHPDWGVRHEAAWGLVATADETCIAPMVRALEDENHWAVDKLCGALRRLGPAAHEDLLDYVENGVSFVGRAKALELLVRARSPRLGPVLVRMVEREDRETEGGDDGMLRGYVIRAIAALELPGAVPFLRRELAHADWPRRAHAADGLAALGAAEAIPDLRALLSDRNEWVVKAAKKALAALEAGKAGSTEARAAKRSSRARGRGRPSR